MNRNDDHLDHTLDRAIDEIRRDAPEDAAIESAAERVRDRLAAELQSIRSEQPETARIRSCDDYQSLIPAYVAGRLTEARQLLLEDHGRECVPCRKAIKTAKGGQVRTAAPARKKRRSLFSPDLSWGIAATILIGVALVGLAYKGDLFTFSTGGWIQVENIDGDLFQVSEFLTTPANAGEVFSGGEPVRTAKESGAVLNLEDGSRVEMNERSELYVTRSGADHTIHLNRGDIIVEAAPQGNGRLYVKTPDCKVEVTGTVFAVSSGTKGSRVSVIEGEVVVRQDGDVDVLSPGDQITSSDNLRQIPVEQDIAWSRELDRHLALLTEFAEFRKELEERLPEPEMRYSTRLLDAAPEDTVMYVAFPNLTPAITEAYDLLQERIGTSEVLQSWWQDNVAGTGAEPDLELAIERIRQFGDHLGDEIAVTLQAVQVRDGSVGVGMAGPVVLATLTDPDGFRSLLESEIESISMIDGNDRPEIAIVDNPFAAAAVEADLLFWIDGDVVVAAPELDDLRTASATLGSPDGSRFRTGSFYQALSDVYAEGTGIVFGADIETILARNRSDDSGDEALELTGFGDMRHIVVERHDAGETNVTRASLTFRQDRRGMASWLAAPAPMGALEFVSPDATAAAAFVVRTPSEALGELFAALAKNSDSFQEELARAEAEIGVDIVDDIAGPLGGEFAFALDGPILPKPAWKAIVEVYDPAGMQRTLEWMVERLNEFAEQDGRGGFLLTPVESGGRTYHQLASEEFGLSMTYTFVDGYFVAAPDRVMIDRALQFRKQGLSLAASSRFADLLPTDGRGNASAIAFQNLGEIMGALTNNSLSQSMNLTPEQEKGLQTLAAFSEPSVVAAYGENDRIEIVGSDRGNLLFGNDLGRLFDLGTLMNFESMLDEAVREAGDGVYDGDDDGVVVYQHDVQG